MNQEPAHTTSQDCKEERDRLARTTTHLANARTYLAWVRTSIAIMAFGFVLERVDLLFLLTPGVGIPHETVRQLGLVSRFCFAAGAIVLLLAAARSRAIGKRIGPDGTRFRGVAEAVLLLATLALALYFSVSSAGLVRV